MHFLFCLLHSSAVQSGQPLCDFVISLSTL